MYALGSNTIDPVKSIPGLFISEYRPPVFPLVESHEDVADEAHSITSACSEESLAKHGISHRLSVVGKLEFSRGTATANDLELQSIQLDIGDNPYEDLLVALDGLCAWLDEALQSNKERRTGGVLVHCIQGISRSGAVVIAYLMRTHQIGFDDALYIAQRSRPQIRPNSGFTDQLRLWEELGYTIFDEAGRGDGQDGDPKVKQQYIDWKSSRGLLLSKEAEAKQEHTRKTMTDVYIQFRRPIKE